MAQSRRCSSTETRRQLLMVGALLQILTHAIMHQRVQRDSFMPRFVVLVLNLILMMGEHLCSPFEQILSRSRQQEEEYDGAHSYPLVQPYATSNNHSRGLFFVICVPHRTKATIINGFISCWPTGQPYQIPTKKNLQSSFECLLSRFACCISTFGSSMCISRGNYVKVWAHALGKKFLTTNIEQT
jgi:hypothetical protein